MGKWVESRGVSDKAEGLIFNRAPALPRHSESRGEAREGLPLPSPDGGLQNSRDLAFNRT